MIRTQVSLTDEEYEAAPLAELLRRAWPGCCLTIPQNHGCATGMIESGRADSSKTIDDVV
jgi:hypothetical protein